MSQVKLTAVGDMILHTRSGEPPLTRINTALKDKDILFGNLETVLSERGIAAEKAVVFRAPPGNVKYLVDAGFDVLNIANNHVLDMGEEALIDTVLTLKRARIPYVGVRTPECNETYRAMERNGIRVCFLGYYGRSRRKSGGRIGITPVQEDIILQDVSRLKEECNHVVVSLHWGTENVFYPAPWQIQLAHRIIDAGATVILGHHPHSIQGIENYNNGLIAYSPGNFQIRFNPAKCQGRRIIRTSQSFILKVILDEAGMVSHDIVPVEIDGDWQPFVPEAAAGEEIRNFISAASEPLAEKRINDNWWYEQIAREYLSGNFDSAMICIRRYGFRHLVQCCYWLMSPLCIRCYLGLARRFIKKVIRQK